MNLLLVWYLIEGLHIGKITGVRIQKVFPFMMILSVGFWVITEIPVRVWIQLLLYIVFYMAITIVIFQTTIAELFKKRTGVRNGDAKDVR